MCESLSQWALLDSNSCKRPCKLQLPGMMYPFKLKGGMSPLYANKIKNSHEAACREFVCENMIDKLL